jgi:hypothetical protein
MKRADHRKDGTWQSLCFIIIMESGVNRHEAAAGKTKKHDITVPIPEIIRDIGNTKILSTVIKKLRADC